MRSVLEIAVLTAIYLVVLASLDPWDGCIGLVLSAGWVALFRGRFAAGGEPISSSEALARAGRFFPFLGAAALRMAAATGRTALVCLGLRSWRRAGPVSVPVGDRTPRGLAVSALVFSAAPGSVLLEVDRERGVMFYHVLEADPESFRAEGRSFYERRQKLVFP